MNLVKLGSQTAKSGFRNEKDVAEKFEKWKQDKEAKKWLKIMGYNLKEIRNVKVVVLPNKYKSDIQIQLIIDLRESIDTQNISIKRAKKQADYNQVDKRWIDDYKEMWNISQNITNTLKRFCGETIPQNLLERGEIKQKEYDNLRDKRRFFFDEIEQEELDKLINFFKNNKIKVLADILKGKGKFSAEWFLVTQYDEEKNSTKWILKDINFVLNFFGNGEVELTKHGSLKIGKVILQRKGGDGGRETAQMLQFKISPCDLFNC